MGGLAGRRWVLVGLVVVTSGCVAHPVGPARSFESYAAKASTTTASALSAVETVRLLAHTAADGGAFVAYTAIAVSEQEDTLAGLDGTFASIQPPDERSVDVRDEVTELLARATDHVADVRIEVRRGHLGDLERVAGPLAQDATDLRAMLARLP